eukprot:gene20311-33411_t
MFIVLLMLPGTYAQPPSIVADGENMRVEDSRGSITLSANSKEVTVQAIVDGIALAQAQADAVESMRATLDTVATAAGLSEVSTKVNDILSDLDVYAKQTDLAGLQEQVDALSADHQNFTASTKISYNQLMEFAETIQDQASSTKTALAELARRIDEKDQAEKPDDSNRACHEHLLDGFTTDGTYTITSSVGKTLKVYCDMSGGGWTLIGMVHTSSSASKVDEPDDWFTKGNYPDSAKQLRLFETNTNRHNTPPLSHGVDVYQTYVADAVKRSPATPLLRIEVIAQENLEQKNTWWKDVTDAKTFSTLFSSTELNLPTSRACSDLLMSKGCIGRNAIGRKSDGQDKGLTTFVGMHISVDGEKISWGD